jgi:hypothetical protein
VLWNIVARAVLRTHRSKQLQIPRVPATLWAWNGIAVVFDVLQSMIYGAVNACNFSNDSNIVITCIYSLQSVLRGVHSLFQSKFFTECNLVIPLSVSSILSFPCRPVDAYIFFPVITCCLNYENLLNPTSNLKPQ